MARQLDAKKPTDNGWRDDIQVPFGLRDGLLWGPMEVERGQHCRCHCPGCGSALVARPGNGKHRPHFAHSGSSGSEGCLESSVHRFAKKAVVEATRLWLPAWIGAPGLPNPPEARDDGGVLHWGEAVDWPARECGVRGGQEEVAMDEIRPDVVLDTDEGIVLVEICVTHPVGPDKAATVRARGYRMVEIDLSACPSGLLDVPTAFREWVVNTAPRHWIWEPGAAAEWQRHAEALSERMSRQGVMPVMPCAPASSTIDWDAFRRLFEEREIVPLRRSPIVDDPLIGCWVWLDGHGPAEITERLTRMGGVYRVRLEDGREQIMYLGRHQPPAGKFNGVDQ